MKIISWNVNGLRAIHRKNSLEEIWEISPDIFCLQETKISEEDLTFDLKYIPNYEAYFSSAKRKGYSGVGMYTKISPKAVKYTFGDEKFDNEGRVIQADFDNFKLFNIYFPNGKSSSERLEYKINFYYSFLEVLKELIDQGEKIIVCGDVNTAHKEIDLARPKQNEKISGFLPEEREWIDKLITTGFIDTFRYFNKEPENYTWWDYKSKARERNGGWRIDYFFVSENLVKHLKDSYIFNDIMGSDHAPIVLELDNSLR